jgi:formate--tetrahydrofolate ligase
VFPSAVVLVITLRALARHGGGAASELSETLVERGLLHLDHHLRSMRAFGVAPVAALNVFADDPEGLLELVERKVAERGIAIARVTAFSEGGAGATDLARRVVAAMDASGPVPPASRSLYPDTAPFMEKLRVVARTLYGARDVVLTAGAEKDLSRLSSWGYGALPPCVAKTPLSLSDDSKHPSLGDPFELRITSLRLSAGAGFLVALAGDVSTMPGLPREPAARRVRVSPDGAISGLMQGE